MSPEPYLLYKEKCIDDLHNLQEEFKKLYDFDNHTEWHYDHGIGIFTLKFKSHVFYFEYTNLTTGLIDGEREIGWEMTAVANKQINGFGAYRVPSDHLDSYFLFIKEIDEDAYQKIKKKHIECGEHGSRRVAFVCQHLNHGQKTGFEEAFPTHLGMELGEEDDFQAWCDECEKTRLKYGDWNEESVKFANIKLICEKCYFEIKEFNLRKGSPKKEKSFTTLFKNALKRFLN